MNRIDKINFRSYLVSLLTVVLFDTLEWVVGGAGRALTNRVKTMGHSAPNILKFVACSSSPYVKASFKRN